MSESITITANSIDNPETDVRRNERFHLVPRKRLEALVTTSGLIGAMIGFYDGVKISSLRYLTENAHRMPKTVGGCFKYGAAVGGFFGLEYLLDISRGNTIDFFNTTTAAFLTSTFYAKYNKLSSMQTRKMIFKGTALGLTLGLIQDYLIHARKGRVWYLDRYTQQKLV
ncbi:hypothetical protein FOB64_004514 [Candida albicans]|uniref:Uncharacterized protein n=1 Tax=Candida albicans TaxID=5476 RepID=A0A8H6BZK5_CANAX|nr:hypothetical protein FOB64_004514 [Candida albicans]